MPERAGLTLIAALLAFAGCSVHEVTTMSEWCEQISGIDLVEKNAPFWAVFPGIRVKGDAIRDDIVTTLNAALLEKVEQRSARMAWREGNDLHLWNLSTFFEIEPEEVIEEWRIGIERSRTFQDPNDQHRCVFGSITSLFDNVRIHSGVWDPPGLKLVHDDVTTLPTERQQRLKKPL